MKAVLHLLRWAKWVLLLLLAYILLVGILTPVAQRPVARSFSLPEVTADSERVLCVDDNEEALIWRLRLIEAAQEEILFTTFDFRDDESGRAMIAAFLEAAERGVQVRMIVDGVQGMLRLPGSDAFRALASHPNVEVRLYSPLNLLKPWELNYRMHDKYLVVDSSAYLLGGRNTNDLFLGGGQESYNIDRDLLVYETGPAEGTSLAQVQAYFEQIWEQPCCKRFSGSLGEKKQEAAFAQLREEMEGLRQTRPEAFQPVDWVGETLPARKITLLTNATQARKKEPELWEALVEQMSQGEDCLILTPYIICDGEMYQGLAQLAEGRRLEILTNAVENGANPWGCTDYLNCKDKILATGAGVYEAIPEQSLHTKTILVDDWLSIVGSYNLDIRSTRLDTELMLAVDCPELNAQLRQSAQELMAQSKHTAPTGEVTQGERYEPVALGGAKKVIYAILRVVILPIRHLL